MSSVRLLSPAKVNLFLRVLGRRPDGYHEIQSLAQPVSLFDEIAVSVGEGGGVSLSAAGKEVPSGGDNLAAAAASAYLEEASLEKRVSVAIRKKIPIGAGLGGGSSNAAAVLAGLDRLLGKLGEEDILRVAARLGADVPFFTKSASSFMEGVGERVRVLPDFPLFHYVIVFPEKSVSTREVYRRWREPETPPERVDPGGARRGVSPRPVSSRKRSRGAPFRAFSRGGRREGASALVRRRARSRFRKRVIRLFRLRGAGARGGDLRIPPHLGRFRGFFGRGNKREAFSRGLNSGRADGIFGLSRPRGCGNIEVSFRWGVV